MLKRLLCGALAFTMLTSSGVLQAAADTGMTGAGVSSVDLGTAKVNGLKVVSKATNSVKLQWKETRDADGYEVYYRTVKTKKYKLISTVNSGSKVTVKIKKLKAKTKYYFKVRARQNGKNGAFSKVVAVRTKPVPKLTDSRSKDLYKKAEKVADNWLFTPGGCGYMSNDHIEYYDENGQLHWAYPVCHSSIHSVADLKKHVSKYFTKKLYEPIVDYAYRDIDGQLYFIASYGIGGPEVFKLKKVSVISQSGDTAKISVRILSYIPNSSDPYRRITTRKMKLVYRNDKWYFANPFYVIYGPSKIKVY